MYELGFGFNLGVFLKLGFVSLFRDFPEIWIFPKNSRLSESVMVLIVKIADYLKFGFLCLLKLFILIVKTYVVQII